MLAAVALIVLSTAGFANALYFTLVTYRWMRPDPRWLPPVCRMDEETCARVVDTPYARVLGLPNSVYGLAWYAVVAAAGVILCRDGALPLPGVLIAVSAGTVVLSAYLLWALVRRLRTLCVLCLAGHAVNLAILVALLLA